MEKTTYKLKNGTVVEEKQSFVKHKGLSDVTLKSSNYKVTAVISKQDNFDKISEVTVEKK